MSRILTGIAAIAIALMALTGCAAPSVPDELGVALRQRDELGKAGAQVYAGSGFGSYVERLSRAEAAVRAEGERFRWLRNYEPSANELKAVISMGESLKDELRRAKDNRAANIKSRENALRREIARHRNISESIGGLGGMRKNLAQAGTLLDESMVWLARHDLDRSEDRIEKAETFLQKARLAIQTSMARYIDSAQIAAWRKMKNEAISLSRDSGREVIVIEKLERTLDLYRGGKHVKSYRVGLGKKGFSDKLHSGDRATPEGHYQIVKKNPNSKFYKALLINYPNEEDIARYRAASRKGNVPRYAGIGGLVEIHGGGSTSLTDGCISMDNSDINELYALIKLNTPVTIVGTTDEDNILHGLLARDLPKT